MNVISILISGRDFKQPYSLNDKSPNNSTGLCNQLFHFINSVSMYSLENDVYFDFFSKDYRSGDLLKLSDILDIQKMKSLYNWRINDLIEFEGVNYTIFRIGGVFMTYNSDVNKFIDITKKIIFNDKYELLSKKVIDSMSLNEEEVNLVHLRIDHDAEDHISRHVSKSAFESYINSYKREILKNCSTDKKLVLLLEDINHPLVKELSSIYNVVYFSKDLILETYNSMYDDKVLDGREMYALIDLLIGKNLKVDTYICAEGGVFTSSFSILLKHLNQYKKIITI